jgi:acyl carrier protein
MTEAEILAGIADVARAHLGWDRSLRPEMRLVEDLELDSLKVLTLAVEVENRFKVCLDPESERQIVTVDDLVATVRRKLEG